MNERAAENESEVPFAFRRNGTGATLNWKAMATILGFLTVAITAYVSLKQDVAQHTRDISEIKADVKGTQSTVNKMDGKLDALLRR